MASSAIPFIFPGRAYPSRVVRRRLDAPGRAGIAGDPPRCRQDPGDRCRTHVGRKCLRPAGSVYPSLAQIAGHALSSIFLDSMSVDLERMSRINRTLALIPPQVRHRARAGAAADRGSGNCPIAAPRPSCGAPCHALPWAGARPAARHRRHESERRRIDQLPAVRARPTPVR
jgi:NTE family protein